VTKPSAAPRPTRAARPTAGKAPTRTIAPWTKRGDAAERSGAWWRGDGSRGGSHGAAASGRQGSTGSWQR
jgi:hypothetical protein